MISSNTQLQLEKLLRVTECDEVVVTLNKNKFTSVVCRRKQGCITTDEFELSSDSGYTNTVLDMAILETSNLFFEAHEKKTFPKKSDENQKESHRQGG